MFNSTKFILVRLVCLHHFSIQGKWSTLLDEGFWEMGTVPSLFNTRTTDVIPKTQNNTTGYIIFLQDDPVGHIFSEHLGILATPTKNWRFFLLFIKANKVDERSPQATTPTPALLRIGAWTLGTSLRHLNSCATDSTCSTPEPDLLSVY